MNLVEVDVIGVEPLEAGFDAVDDVEAREADLVRSGAGPAANLGGEHDIVAPAFNRLSHHHFRLARRVDIGRVDEIDAAVERAMHDGIDRRLIEAADHLPHLSAAAEGHGAQAQLRDEHAGICQWSEFH